MANTAGDRRFVLEQLEETRLRSMASAWNVAIDDRRLAARGIAAAIARKRTITMTEILDALRPHERGALLEKLGLSTDGSAAVQAKRLRAALEGSTVGALIKAANRAARERGLVTHEATLIAVIDGDTLDVRFDGADHRIRIRGIDAAESTTSDKAEKDLDRVPGGSKVLFPIGERTTAWLKDELRGRRIFLDLQPVVGPARYLAHKQHRLLALVRLDRPDGDDLGALMIREGRALVWPRGLPTRRYLHPRSDQYLDHCHAALRAQPGEWGSGLRFLCPATRRDPRRWTREDCRVECGGHPREA